MGRLVGPEQSAAGLFFQIILKFPEAILFAPLPFSGPKKTMQGRVFRLFFLSDIFHYFLAIFPLQCYTV